MKPILQTIHEALDQKMEDWKKSGDIHDIPCKEGCFHCCREPAYGERSEIRYALASLPPEEIERIKPLVKAWYDRFMEAGFDKHEEVSCFDYRPRMLWCPLLKDGRCVVYAKRPVCCRLHIALKTNEGCVNDDLRKGQMFATYPGLGEELNRVLMEDHWSRNEVASYDHLGILLYEELFGVESPTLARVEFKLDGDTVFIKDYKPEPETTETPP